MNNKNKSILAVIVVLVLMVGGVPGQQIKMIELDVKLPKPIVSGTPREIRGTNLDPVNKGKLRGAFLVPEGTILLSAKKAVTSSDSFPVNGSLEMITDGDKESVDGSYVELGPNKQWVKLDLGVPCSIQAVVIWHLHSQAVVYRDVIVQVADDPDFVANVRTVFNNDNDNTTGIGAGQDYEYIESHQGKLIDVKSMQARFVKLYSNGSTAGEMNHYIEVEVYGKPCK